jgi:hypothetical protein
VKSASSPKVYVIAADGSIRWVTDGSILAERYGDQWTRIIDVLDDTLLADYALGAPIATSTAFYAAIAR